MPHYHQVPTVVDVGAMTDAVRLDPGQRCGSTGWRRRSRRTPWRPRRCGRTAPIPGTSVRTAWLCRDKPSMKEALRAAGVPTAASAAVTTRRPRCTRSPTRSASRSSSSRAPAPGALDTTRVDDRRPARRRRWAASAGRASSRSRSRSSSRATRASTTPCRSTGTPPLDFVSHYYPNVLEAMRTRWISPQFVSTNRVDSAAGLPASCASWAHRVNEALGIGTSATHMEWFFGPKGLRFSEIGCRPPGVGAWDLYSAGQRPRPLPRVGERDRARPRRPPARRGGSPPGSSPCGPTATGTSPATPASTRSRPGSASG